VDYGRNLCGVPCGMIFLNMSFECSGVFEAYLIVFAVFFAADQVHRMSRFMLEKLLFVCEAMGNSDTAAETADESGRAIYAFER